MTMENSAAGLVLGFPKSSTSRRLLCSEAHSKHQHTSHSVNDSSKPKERRLGPKITQVVNGRLSLGAKFLRMGGVAKVFKQSFNVREGERLLKVFQCYLSTTAGPIAGLLFISNGKVAFCSKKPIKICSENGELVKIQYKVAIPLTRIKRASESTNANSPSKKYLEIVTVDNFDFWFMGFLNSQKTFRYLLEAISQVHQ